MREKLVWEASTRCVAIADAAKRANKIWKERLASYVAPPLDDAIDEELKEYIAKRKSELPDTFS